MKNNKLPSIVILLILTLITVVFWITFSIYRSFMERDLVTTIVTKDVLLPLTPKLDMETFEMIEKRIYP